MKKPADIFKMSDEEFARWHRSEMRQAKACAIGLVLYLVIMLYLIATGKI